MVYDPNQEANRIEMAPPVVIGDDKNQHLVPQVFVAQVHPQLVREIAAYTALLVIDELRKEGILKAVEVKNEPDTGIDQA